MPFLKEISLNIENLVVVALKHNSSAMLLLNVNPFSVAHFWFEVLWEAVALHI
jgi:hypothetical protein